MFGRSEKLGEFEVGDVVDISDFWIRRNPERDCSGEARVVQVTEGMNGAPVYGVELPNMEEGFAFYWIHPGDLSRA